MNKLQLTLTPQEAMAFSYQASLLGYDLTRFVKYELSKLAEKFLKNIPEVEVNAKTKQMIEKSYQQYKKGQYKTTTDLKKLLA